MEMKCQTATTPYLRHACAGCVQNYKGHDRLSLQLPLLQKDKKEQEQMHETGGEGSMAPIRVAI